MSGIRPRAFDRRWLRALALGVFVSACAGGADGPRQQMSTPAGPTAPPPTVNTPPSITSLTTSSPRAEADAEIGATATVEDAETPIDQLAYQWSASPASGVFTGSGRDVKWRAPKGQTTPDLYTLTLLVIETYTSGGQPAQNKTSKSVQVHYNDSPAEITRIGMRFLTELFPTFTVSPKDAVQDFSDNCRGKSDELSDVTANRANFHILSGTFTGITIDFNGDKTFADSRGRCEFEDIPTNPTNPNFGKRERVSGTCQLTAVYENWKWFLCDSHFLPPYGTTIESLRGRVPGRIILSEPPRLR